MRHERRPRFLLIALGSATVALATARPAHTEVVSEDELGGVSAEIGAVLRSFTFVLAGDVLDAPYNPSDQSPTGIATFDVRLYGAYTTPELKLVLHDQWNVSLQNHDLASPIALGGGSSPPRWLPLHARLSESGEGSVTLREDVDWLYAAWSPGPLAITIGRQPITFGRGRLWRTADLIGTFGMTAVDTEYKPGADAVRLDWQMGEQSSLTAVAAVGEMESSAHDLEASLRGSSFLGRVKVGGDWGELGATAGLVRYDAVAAVDAAIDAQLFDLYGELTLTQPSPWGTGAPGAADPNAPVVKALVGATARPASRWTLVPELMFNGFGSWDATDYLPLALSQRVQLGEQVGLGRLYLGVSHDVELHPLWHVVSAQIVNIADPSALLLLGLRHSLGENVDIYAGGYVPTGRRPDLRGGYALGSEFGSYPAFGFVEVAGVI